jgi:hypothetical protein
MRPAGALRVERPARVGSTGKERRPDSAAARDHERMGYSVEKLGRRYAHEIRECARRTGARPSELLVWSRMADAAPQPTWN